LNDTTDRELEFPKVLAAIPESARSKKVRDHIDRALSFINEVHHNFTT